MVVGGGRGDKVVDLGKGVLGDDIDGLDLVGDGRGVGGCVRGGRVGNRFVRRGKATAKAGEDDDEEDET